MGIKHSVTKTSEEKGYASEWNDNHIIDGDIDLGQYEFLNQVIENRTDFPAGPVAGQIIYRTDLTEMYIYDGAVWVAYAGIDVADFIHHDGSIDFTAAQDMGGFQLKNMADPTLIQDAATKNYVDNIAAIGDNLGNHIATQDLDMDGFEINDLAPPVLDTDAATKKYVDDTAGGAPVTSVFGRVGAVVAANNDYTWAQVNKAVSDIANITTRSHASLTSIGTNTHAQIDTHIANVANPHATTYTQVGAIQNANDRVLDSHINWGSGITQVDGDDVPDGGTRKLLTTGVQTIAGAKTFTSFPVTPSAAPTANYQVANKKYVDDTVGIAHGTYYWSCGAQSFTPATKPANYPIIETAGDSVSFIAGSPANMIADIYLPNGAVITNAVVYGSDATESWYLYRAEINSTAAGAEMATAAIGTEDITITNPTVDNSTYKYWIYTTQLENPDLLYGARITYTI